MIHTAMLGRPDPLIGHPNHWVTLTGGVKINEGVWYRWDSGHVEFDCYSWGDIFHVSLGEGAFEDYMWGVVTGERAKREGTPTGVYVRDHRL